MFLRRLNEIMMESAILNVLPGDFAIPALSATAMGTEVKLRDEATCRLGRVTHDPSEDGP